MSDHNHVTMNIPDTNPLFDWVLNAAQSDTSIPYASVRIGGVSARLRLSEVRSMATAWDEDSRRYKQHLETSWRLLRDHT